MKNLVGLKELRQNMASYARKVQKGQSFIVLKQSKPLFRIVPVDAWGDEGEWETVVDFTKIRKGGVGIDEVLASLKRLKNS
ncbi:type II toxin-antitoxin system prevent-host-death family antitoxin [Patescibacteria group bacterium]|nr:type II toxin-antitoxin system prevent-host-death family antitoxin [Patescibacteria group bacterium]